MHPFDIRKPDDAIRPALQQKIDNLTKPKGALGRLEELALQAGLVQQTLSPSLSHPHNLIFAADHGITAEGVSFSPREVTWQQCIHFATSTGGGVNYLCRQHGFTLRIIDVGVDYDFPPELPIIPRKVGRGTRNFLHEPAMTTDELDACIAHGAEAVRAVHEAGCNVVSLGEMGIGNTSASSIWMACLANIPLERCVGAGSGLSDEGVRRKLSVLSRALDHYTGDRTDPLSVMRHFGGYEMVAAVGAILQAAELGMLILVDGFILTNCMLAARALCPDVMAYAIFGHCGGESGHQLVLDALHARPLLNLGMRLGEGTGAICAYPIVDSAVRMINEMDTFEGGRITKYFS